MPGQIRYQWLWDMHVMPYGPSRSDPTHVDRFLANRMSLVSDDMGKTPCRSPKHNELAYKSANGTALGRAFFEAAKLWTRHPNPVWPEDLSGEEVSEPSGERS